MAKRKKAAAATPNTAQRSAVAEAHVETASEKLSIPATSPEKKKWKLEVAPLSIPINRRKQTLALLIWALMLPFSIAVSIFFLFSPLFLLMIGYIILINFVDHAASSRGGRRLHWARNLNIWRHVAAFFPVSLHKTTELDPKKNYVFGYHPHGIISIGAFLNFATEATGFSKTFPGLIPHLLTMTINFKIPFYREYLMSLGVCDVSRRSCEHLLRRGPGNSIIIVIGGAKESLDARPGVYELTLAERKGFVKVALQAGASLVPVMSFGEVDVYDQLDETNGGASANIRSWQQKLQKKMGFAIPLFHGRGIFLYNFGLLPFRKPIHTVVGSPIDLPNIPDPSPEIVNRYHKQYCDELTILFDKYKEEYASSRRSSIHIK